MAVGDSAQGLRAQIFDNAMFLFQDVVKARGHSITKPEDTFAILIRKVDPNGHWKALLVLRYPKSFDTKIYAYGGDASDIDSALRSLLVSLIRATPNAKESELACGLAPDGNGGGVPQLPEN